MSSRNAGKRKAAAVDDDDGASESPVDTPKAKRTKSTKASTAGSSTKAAPVPAPPLVKAKSAPGGAIPTTATTAPGAMPTDKSLPEEMFFDRPESGNVRIVAWNVCGLSASQKKGFKSYVEAEDPDILILTETKMNNTPVDSFLMGKYKHQYWSDASKGQAGTAFLSKLPAITMSKTLPNHPDASVVQGRIITVEFESVYVIGTYVPNAGEKLKFMDRRKEWNASFEAHIRSLDAKKPVIWTGDLNVAPTAMDLKRSKENYNKSAGHTEIEISAFKRILDPSFSPSPSSSEASYASNNKFIDVWREHHPKDHHYSYFGYRGNCRSKGIGWRLDYFVLSERLMSRVKKCEIRDTIYGASDHIPLMLDLEGDL